MSNGIIFIWSEKELINDIITVLETKNFIYIENFAVILLNTKLATQGEGESNKENAKPKPKHPLQNSKITSFFKVQPKKETVEVEKVDECKETVVKTTKNLVEDFTSLNHYDPRDLFDNKKSQLFYKSKKVLLMFRRV